MKRENRERLKREMDLEEMQECSFRPQLKKTAGIVNLNKLAERGPIHTRVENL